MSAMWSGRVERLVPLEVRRASLSMEYISPTSSRRFSSSMSRKCSSSLDDNPAWFLRGLPLVGTASGMGIGRGGGSSARRPSSGRRALLFTGADFATGTGAAFAILLTTTAFAETDFEAGVPLVLLP